MKIAVNEDKEVVKKIRAQLKNTHGYCPCVLPSQYSDKTKCICEDFLINVDEGYCHCGLYKKIKD